MSVGRNAKCPCGSGKKYKHCCLEKDREAAKMAELAKISDAVEEEEVRPQHKHATWKVFLLFTGVLGAISLILLAFGLTQVAGAVFGCGMLCLIVYSAFRDVPPARKHPGNGGNIDFGNHG